MKEPSCVETLKAGHVYEGNTSIPLHANQVSLENSNSKRKNESFVDPTHSGSFSAPDLPFLLIMGSAKDVQHT